MSDNFRFDIACGPLEESLKIAFHIHQTATHWEIEKRPVFPTRLIFAWHENAGPHFHRFIAPIGPDEAAFSIRGFLRDIDYGPEPDHDGSNKKGWRIYNEAWGHIGCNCYAFAAVEPIWAMYGK